MPKDVEEKKQIINTIYDKALSLGMAHEDIVVDGLVATIGANPKAAIECYETIAYCKDEKKLPTICGLSNISFGLPYVREHSVSYNGHMQGTHHGYCQSITGAFDECCICIGYAARQT